jgi:hypothetical protein
VIDKGHIPKGVVMEHIKFYWKKLTAPFSAWFNFISAVFAFVWEEAFPQDTE